MARWQVKAANDPGVDYKRLVAQGYDRIARAYEQARRDVKHPEIKWLKKRLPNQAQVLDVGCGSGLPVTRELAKRFIVTGVDISGEQIKLARKHIRHATFIHSDIMGLDFPVESFDAVVALYAIFHLPRGEHGKLITNVRRWLKPGGYLIASFAYEAEEPYTEDDFFGTEMYWSNLGMTEYSAMLSEAGFKILETKTIGRGYGDGASAEQHPLVIAQVK
jgi:ubiquinone/menaquinone biosynthesis C-methylase UbiE